MSFSDRPRSRKKGSIPSFRVREIQEILTEIPYCISLRKESLADTLVRMYLTFLCDSFVLFFVSVGERKRGTAHCHRQPVCSISRKKKEKRKLTYKILQNGFRLGNRIPEQCRFTYCLWLGTLFILFCCCFIFIRSVLGVADIRSLHMTSLWERNRDCRHDSGCWMLGRDAYGIVLSTFLILQIYCLIDWDLVAHRRLRS